MVIKLNGGSADLHMVSLVDMQKLSDSIQKISYNHEYQMHGTRDKTIYITANKEGSFEMNLGLIDPNHLSMVLDGVQGAFLYDLIKKMGEYLNSEASRDNIKKLLDETFTLALELVEAEYFDVKFEKKKQTIENNTKLINAELANYQAMKQITSIVGDSSNTSSLKPTSIEFIASAKNEEEKLIINTQTKELLENNEVEAIKLENIVISGVPDNLSRSGKSFYMEVAFVGKIKIRASDKHLSVVSDYFKEQKSIKIKIEPIVRMGELIKTRDAKLIKIIEEE